MGDAAKRWIGKGKVEAPEPEDPHEKNALTKIRSEAAAAKSHLASGGKGGLPPSLVLGVMRRDKFRCKTCGKRGKPANGLSVHHKGGIPITKKLSKLGHANTPENIDSICENCHNQAHENARKKGVDSSQVLAEGDKGDPKHDHGQPLAPVSRA